MDKKAADNLKAFAGISMRHGEMRCFVFFRVVKLPQLLLGEFHYIEKEELL
jgi:hypothetical protein